ncbi:hypothetical protein QA639_21215 [Bradyrhizobium pachyrhizi]|uniref:hypothetical protein n=1 Tax=Bradyrhizobium pachyrhizi TaxID=280333 RepID=UPI0024B14CDF|nr:hypothetical protein [Bradyrhizobium pachyrhizi]WFU52230.1 hypothetical protein QA639_21215 [Bradyrhizobium pachyrhizi]
MRSSGAERSDSFFVRCGKQYTNAEAEIIRRNRHLKLHELQLLLPGRSRHSISGKRSSTGFTYRRPPFTHGEDEEIRRYAPTRGATGITHVLPHRTKWDITKRARELGVTLFNSHELPLKILGEPLADAIRKRAREDGFSVRALDAELGTGLYFTSCAALRVQRGSKPNMTAIRKAIEFFDAALIPGPDGTYTIDWKDE